MRKIHGLYSYEPAEFPTFIHFASKSPTQAFMEKGQERSSLILVAQNKKSNHFGLHS